MINYIAIHHAGGTTSNPLQSAKHLTFDSIESAHRQVADWQGYKAHKSSLGWHVGYNFVYDAKTRQFKQFRKIGEETLAQKGYNFTAISICIIGNFSRYPNSQNSVDTMTEEMESDIAQFVWRLIKGEHEYIIKDGTEIDLNASRVHPHRWYQNTTACYGSALADDWINTILSKYSVTGDAQERIILLQKLMKLYLQLQKLLQTKPKNTLASIGEPACGGITNI